MKRLIEQRYTIRQNLLAFIGLILFCYFTYHSIFGERSIVSLTKLDSRVETLSEKYARLNERRSELEDKVMRLRPASLDADMLEERARHVLGYAYPDEKIILDAGRRDI